jgi:hypothetical protein
MVGWSMSLGESRALSQPGQKRQCQAALKFPKNRTVTLHESSS